MAVTVTRVSEAVFDDVQAVFGTRGQAARCQCQGYRLGWYDQHSDNVAGRRELLRDQVTEGHGLLAYLDGEPGGLVLAGTTLRLQVLAANDVEGTP